MPIRVLLAEDHVLVRRGVRSLLAATSDIEVVGEASDGREAVALAESLAPDVVVSDLAMSGMNGMEATRQILKARPRTRVIILSMHGEREYVFEALRAGAVGYLLKSSSDSELVTAVRRVVEGHTYLAQALEGIALTDYIMHSRLETKSNRLEKLSAREREVLQLIAEAKSGTEIAAILHISAHTVDTHRRHIMEKIDAHNIVELVKFAIKHGVIDPS